MNLLTVSLLLVARVRGAVVDDDCLPADETPSVQLLQVKTSLLQSPGVDPSFQGALPIEWVHVPKAGSSFVNTLIHVPGICPGLPEDLVVSEENFGHNQLSKFNYYYKPAENCNRSAFDTSRLEHPGIEAVPEGGFEAEKGHFMIFLRQPEQRMISHFNWLYNLSSADEVPVSSYHIEHTAGCVTKMLTKADYGCEGEEPNSIQVAEATRRLRTGFSFIGITDSWELSICLFNVMFNQDCHSYQFENSRPTAGKSTPTYNVSVLNGYRDPYDNELYDLALELFDENLKKFNVSESSCQQCWDAAGI
mmetsp:Transcript_64728/g.145430  ORF Transcript_64728/g.145430 Transcript_64728/m.145430 type:complete len:306 (+) Transcript_64728:81-998(+)